MISIKNLHKYFNRGKQNENHIINDVSLELPDRGMVAIFGKSGCGKTTLLNVIGGLDGFASGTLTIDGQSISKNTDDVRNRYVGYIFQNYNLNKEETCYDNIAAALRLCGMTDEEEIDRRVRAALRNVGLSKYRLRTPDTLSGGQQQRIAIARAIVKNPSIILADEPTGNLDEANTVMIMDLLKEIAKDHLVLLVTHEANLVDYYCDTVIEVSDGRIVGTRQNAAANGFVARDKNDIFLGELERTELSDGRAQIEYYGSVPDEPVRLRIVNAAGKIYVQIGTEKVHLIDETSEVHLREGVYEEREQRAASSASIDMSELTPVEGKRFGRLFTLSSSVKSGYKTNFKKRKKGKKLLAACMCLFAAIVVFMGSFFGTSIDKIINAQGSYNHNVFYVYTPDEQTSLRLAHALGNDESGIDYFSKAWSTNDTRVSFLLSSFETFRHVEMDLIGLDYGVDTNAAVLGASLAAELPVLEGKNADIGASEVVISSKVADAFLEKSTYGYISSRKDALGLTLQADGLSLAVVGIVDTDETAVYVNELTLAALAYAYDHGLSNTVRLGADEGIEVEQGSAVILSWYGEDKVELPAVGSTVTVNGVELTVSSVLERPVDYMTWLQKNGVQKQSEAEFFAAKIKAENPDIVENSQEFWEAMDSAMIERWFEYIEYMFAEAGDYCRELYLFEKASFPLWLYVEKGIEIMKYAAVDEGFYHACLYKQEHGEYPPANDDKWREEYITKIEAEYSDYYQEFGTEGHFVLLGNVCLMNEADYIAASKRVGKTDIGLSYKNAEGGEDVAVFPDGSTAVYWGVEDEYKSVVYTLVHSTDPDKTASWLAAEFSELSAPKGYEAIVTPDAIFDQIIGNSVNSIVSSLIAMGVILVLMCLCMYFIMRSSLMNRIKEIGVYRAIGVSKKNLAFKFFIEALVLFVLTVFVGYLLTSGLLYAAMGMTSLVSDYFFYPLWYAAAIFAVLFVISLFFGTLPIFSLLKRTPSEILAKYDI